MGRFALWRTSDAKNLVHGSLGFESDCRHQLETWGKNDAAKLREQLSIGVDRMGAQLVEELESGNVDVTHALARSRWIPADVVGDFKTRLTEAENGDLDSRCAVGLAYLYGVGVDEDYREAERQFKLAADQGHVLSQYNLGVILSQGYGEPKEPVVSTAYFKAAAENGDADAKRAYKLMKRRLTGAQRRSANDYAKAIVKGDTEAMPMWAGTQ